MLNPANITSQQRSTADPWRVMPAILLGVRRDIVGVNTYQIQLQDPADREAFSARPGQFNMLYVPGVGEAAISLSGNPRTNDPLVHTIRSVGHVTGALSRMAPGTTLGVRGPFGSFWPINSAEGKDLVVVAGGIGLAPLRPVIYDIISDRDRFGRVSLLVGTRTPADELYSREFDGWESAGVEVETTVDRADAGWTGNIGVVTLLLQRLGLADPPNTILFTCGPEVMMTYTIQTALGRGICEENIWVSLERNMNCAIGHCGHCQMGPHFVCKDGPVLRYDHVERLMEVKAL